jgi:hypothetical protein
MTDRLIDRIRLANPVPATNITDHELFARIVAAPCDPRCAAAQRRRRVRVLPRSLALVAAALLCAAGTVGAVELGVFSHASPKALFTANPADRFPGASKQTVIPHTVHQVTTFSVPGTGRFAWWIALSRKGWLCSAIRQPDGTWAALGPDRYNVGGAVPGCGKFPWHDTRGFAYEQISVGSRATGVWRVAYGYAPQTGHPATIRDRISGATARIAEGRYFAIVMPLCRGRKCDVPKNTPPGPYFKGYQLETLDRSGTLLIRDRFDPGM